MPFGSGYHSFVRGGGDVYPNQLLYW